MEPAVEETVRGISVIRIQEVGEFTAPAKYFGGAVRRRLLDIVEVFESRESGRRGLRPKGIVTTEWINDAAILSIEPKCGQLNCFQLLIEAEMPTWAIDDAAVTAGAKTDADARLLDLLCTEFLKGLLRIRQEGRLWADHEVQLTSEVLRGRLHLQQSTVASFRTLSPLLSQTVQRSVEDLPENRVLAAAMHFLLSQRKTLSAQNAMRLLEELPYWAGITPDTRDLPHVRKALERRSLPYERAYYYRPMLLAVSILEHLGPSGTVSRDSMWPPYRYHMDVIFQEAALRWVRKATSPAANTISWADHARTYGQRYFFEGNTNIVNPELKPDILVREIAAPNPLIIFDAKYKLELDASDLYQLSSYAARFGVKHCGFFFLGDANRWLPHNTPDGATYHFVRLNLRDVLRAKLFLKETVAKILRAAQDQRGAVSPRSTEAARTAPAAAAASKLLSSSVKQSRL